MAWLTHQRRNTNPADPPEEEGFVIRTVHFGGTCERHAERPRFLHAPGGRLPGRENTLRRSQRASLPHPSKPSQTAGTSDPRSGESIPARSCGHQPRGARHVVPPPKVSPSAGTNTSICRQLQPTRRRIPDRHAPKHPHPKTPTPGGTEPATRQHRTQKQVAPSVRWHAVPGGVTGRVPGRWHTVPGRGRDSQLAGRWSQLECQAETGGSQLGGRDRWQRQVVSTQ